MEDDHGIEADPDTDQEQEDDPDTDEEREDHPDVAQGIEDEDADQEMGDDPEIYIDLQGCVCFPDGRPREPFTLYTDTTGIMKLGTRKILVYMEFPMMAPLLVSVSVGHHRMMMAYAATHRSSIRS
jgi:hypothetical protein